MQYLPIVLYLISNIFLLASNTNKLYLYKEVYFLMKLQKKIGVGSISILLFIIGILFVLTFKNGVCYGDTILNYLGLRAWSNGTQGQHYTIFYSFVFFIPSIVIGYKFKDNIGSTLGKILSSIVLVIITLAIFFMF